MTVLEAGSKGQLTREQPSYQLRRNRVDVPLMVSQAQDRLVRLRRQALVGALASSAWQQAYPSLMSLDLRRTYRGLSSSDDRIYPFDPTSGAVAVPSDWVQKSPLGSFFNNTRTINDGRVTLLRGSSYYQALDFSLNTREKRMAAIQRDLQEGLDLVATTRREDLSLPGYLLFLGVLDHNKMHTISLLHALTYPERSGRIPQGFDYQALRQTAQEAVFRATRAFYRACLGQPFDAEFNPQEIKNTTSRVGNYLLGANPDSYPLTTYPEVTHPVIIMLGAHEAARQHPLTNTIVGIPSGGTEIAMVVNLMYEALYPDQPPPGIELVSLSFHYKKISEDGISPDKLVAILQKLGTISGRRVLIIDDNSNSGSTLQRMSEASVRAGATEVSAHIAEIDPARVLVNSGKEDNPRFFGVVDMLHEDLSTAMGVAHASREDGSDLTRKTIKRKLEKLHRRKKKINSTGVD